MKLALVSPPSLDQHGGRIAVLLGLIVTPYFLLRGWLNATGTLLALFALWRVLATGAWRVAMENRTLAVLAAALATPLAATLTAQALHGEFAARHIDSPLRLALGGALLLYLYARRVDWLRIAGVALPVSLFLCAALIYAPGASRYYWGPRIASYFMDPLMLAQHSALVGFLCLFLVRRDDARYLTALKIIGWLTGLGISFSTGSRTGWLMMPILTLLWIISTGRLRRPGEVALSIGAVALAMLAIYAGSSFVQERVDQIAVDISAYLAGKDLDSSVGLRLSLFRTAWAAFLDRPLAGWGFVTLPTPELLPSTAALWTDALRFAYVHNGTHSEWLQPMMRMGILGLIARVAQYLVPLAIFIRIAASGQGQQRVAGYLGLVVVIGYLTASFTSEVSNLVYLSTFYAVMIASFGAIALRPHTP